MRGYESVNRFYIEIYKLQRLALVLERLLF